MIMYPIPAAAAAAAAVASEARIGQFTSRLNDTFPGCSSANRECSVRSLEVEFTNA